MSKAASNKEPVIHTAKGVTLYQRKAVIYARYTSPRGVKPSQQKFSTQVNIEATNAIKTAMKIAEMHRSDLIERFNAGDLDKTVYSLGDVLSQYVKDINPRDQDLQSLSAIIDFFGKYFIMNTFSVEDVTDYKLDNIGRPHKPKTYKLKDGSEKVVESDKTVKPSTVRRELAKLSAAISHCQNKRGWEIPNPTIRNLPSEEDIFTEQAEHYIPSAEEWEQLKAAAFAHTQVPHLLDFIMLMTNLGWRPGAILSLKWSQVDWDEQTITPAKRGHIKKNTAAIINSAAKEALERRKQFCKERCPDSPWVFPSSKKDYKTPITCIKKSFSTMVQDSGLAGKHFTPHTLRHLVATRLRKYSGLDNTSKILGHADTRITEKVYEHLPNTELAHEYNVLAEIFGNDS